SAGPEGPYRVPLAGAEEDPALAALLEPLPDDLRLALLAAGLEPVVARLLRDLPEGEAPDYAWLARRQALSNHLGSLEVQADALAFEVDCTGDFVEGLRNGIERDEAKRELRMTIASIVIGASATISAVSWGLKTEDERGPAILEVSGAGAAAALGLTAFLSRSHAIVLEHPRNLLAP